MSYNLYAKRSLRIDGSDGAVSSGISLEIASSTNRWILPVESISLPKRLAYDYIGRINAFAYDASRRTLLGMRVATWLEVLLVAALLWGLVRNWSAGIMLVLLGLFIWLIVTLWTARRRNYTRFVPAPEGLPDGEERAGLRANQRVNARATGIFSVSSRDANVFQQPAQYWQVPLGDHVVMVEERPGKYAYQFFNARSLQAIHKGWLLFGPRPLDCIALTFLAAWGPEYTKFEQYDDGQPSATPPKSRTIYLTFDEPAEEEAVWYNVIGDARRAREAPLPDTPPEETEQD